MYGLFSCKCYTPNYNLKDYPCPRCHTKHPLEPISFTTLCPSAKRTHLRRLINNTWSTTTCTTIHKWYPTAPPGEKRNYSRTLIPTSLSNALRTPPPNTCYSSHKSHLLRELKSRTKRFNTVLHSLSRWFQDNPIPNFDSLVPIANNNPWYIPNSKFSTSSTQLVKLSHPTFPNKPPINKKPNSCRLTVLEPKPKNAQPHRTFLPYRKCKLGRTLLQQHMQHHLVTYKPTLANITPSPLLINSSPATGHQPPDYRHTTPDTKHQLAATTYLPHVTCMHPPPQKTPAFTYTPSFLCLQTTNTSHLTPLKKLQAPVT